MLSLSIRAATFYCNMDSNQHSLSRLVKTLCICDIMAVMISIFRWFWIGTLLTSMVGGFYTQHGTAVSRGLLMSRGFSSTPPSRGRSETSPRGKSGFEKSQGSSKRAGPSSRAGRSVETGYDKKRSSTSGKREEQVNDDIKLESSERIQKLIARSGIASRRDAEKMVKICKLPSSRRQSNYLRDDDAIDSRRTRNREWKNDQGIRNQSGY